MQAFGFLAARESIERLERRHNLPTLNINALDAAAASAASRAIVRLASAAGSAAGQSDRSGSAVRPAHRARAQAASSSTRAGRALRASHPQMARVTRTGGYRAGRTSMELPLANVVAALSTRPRAVVRLPTIGGSAVLRSRTCSRCPLRLSIVNFDNQHGRTKPADQEPVKGSTPMAALLTMK